jgi:AAA+ superfamily predicted ATPase
MPSKSSIPKTANDSKVVRHKARSAGLLRGTLASESARNKRVWMVSRYAKQRDSVAQALGEQLQLPVKRVDLSKTVGNDIGETEKNLSQIFEEAEGRNWVLFFDEADALFAQSTDETDGHDGPANQEVSYFLEQVERSNCPVVVATRRKQDLDPTIVRRLRMSVVTPLPLPKVRVKLRPSPVGRDT